METVYDDKDILKNMQETFGFQSYMSFEQEKSVKAVLRGDKNIIVSMPTSSGKSLCFYLPSLLQRNGIIFVICPNLSLLENQMNYLNKVDLRTKSINSTTSPGSIERRDIRESLLDKKTNIKFFFMCPEMAAMDYYNHFINKMLELGLISHFVIDEAHCVIDKGFRSSFKVLKDFRINHPTVPFIALTTASKPDTKKIQENLGMINPTTIRASSVKANIFYDAVELKDDENIDFLKFFKQMAPDFETLKAKDMLTGIIYCLTFKQLEATVKALEDLNVPNLNVTTFHSKLNAKNRFENYEDWMSNKAPVMVATTESFGLGIVKIHVRFVIHTNVPKNLRAYYQESGRGGSGGDQTRSRVYFKRKELNLNQMMKDYLMSSACRKKLLAKHFGDVIEDCSDKCDNCMKNNLDVTSPKKAKLI